MLIDTRSLDNGSCTTKYYSHYFRARRTVISGNLQRRFRFLRLGFVGALLSSFLDSAKRRPPVKHGESLFVFRVHVACRKPATTPNSGYIIFNDPVAPPHGKDD